MLKPKFDVDSLTTTADLIARIVPAKHLFTLMSRSILIPAGWVALATRTSRDPLLIRGGDHYNDEDTMDVLFVRDTPVECMTQASSLRSADGFACRGSIRVSLRVPAEPAELSTFRKTVIGSTDSISNPAALAAMISVAHTGPTSAVFSEILKGVSRWCTFVKTAVPAFLFSTMIRRTRLSPPASRYISMI